MLVTGAASGMGRAIAEVFDAEGAKVAATDRNRPTCPAKRTGRSTSPTAPRSAPSSREVVETLGPVDILVNCAGVSLPAPIDAETYDDAWDLTLAVNLVGYVHMIQACLPHLARDGRAGSSTSHRPKGSARRRTSVRTP